eukprot:TRINITY_DN11754_c0_g1_i1.p1 TRINITY_DN11754_c0_g1~~TRINITY_DN11754_c0_g1_i1.p1  ORF type:complete len:316 (-),score=59.66 TRINITY_DN11754_c0_g1_i1:417-1364(-)
MDPTERHYIHLNDTSIEKLIKNPFNPVLLNKYWKKYSDNPSLIKLLRKYVQMDTIQICDKLQYVLHDGNVVSLDSDDVKKTATSTVFYDMSLLFDQVSGGVSESDLYEEEVVVDVFPGDCIDAGIFLKEEGYHPLILNMASNYKPGGGYMNGAGAQEENLFRRTNYIHSLEDFNKWDEDRDWGYPLEDYQGIYSPNVFVFRESEANSYTLMEAPIRMSFVAVPAVRRPKIYKSGGVFRLNENIERVTRNKMRMIFKIALENGHDSLVLSAMGCGAFGNPPNHIASLFKEVTQEFKSSFRLITFAIISDKNCHKKT